MVFLVVLICFLSVRHGEFTRKMTSWNTTYRFFKKFAFWRLLMTLDQIRQHTRNYYWRHLVGLTTKKISAEKRLLDEEEIRLKRVNEVNSITSDQILPVSTADSRNWWVFEGKRANTQNSVFALKIIEKDWILVRSDLNSSISPFLITKNDKIVSRSRILQGKSAEGHRYWIGWNSAEGWVMTPIARIRELFLGLTWKLSTIGIVTHPSAEFQPNLSRWPSELLLFAINCFCVKTRDGNNTYLVIVFIIPVT